MRKLSFFLLTALLIQIGVISNAHAQPMHPSMVLVKGGTFKDKNSNFYGKGVKVSSFYIGRCDVTGKEWASVMGNDPSKFKGADMPVEMVSWYDCIEYCNKRSLKEGLKPYYNIDKTTKDPNNLPDPNNGDLDQIKWIVTVNPGANGYRLPTEAEWEYAASGGQLSKGYVYSGSNHVDTVAWYWRNSGDQYLKADWQWPILQMNHNRAKRFGLKKPNELGLYDMSGDVRQWCWDWFGQLDSNNTTDPTGSSSGYGRVWKGGGWIGADYCCKVSFRSSLAANGMGPDQGLRVCRSR